MSDTADLQGLPVRIPLREREPERHCRICGVQVVNVDNKWVDLDGLGRLWLCTDHMAGASFVALWMNGGRVWAYEQRYMGERIVIGPYDYGRPG